MTQPTGDMHTGALLSMFMYLDLPSYTDGTSLGEIMTDLQQVNLQGTQKVYYDMIHEAIGNDTSLGNMQISHQSKYMTDPGFNSGTSAAVFEDPQTGANFVAFRGTGDGEWLDNGKGIVQVSTEQQDQALRYFETVAEREKWTSDDNIIVTGHSKGGNKAQYITMNNGLIDACYSIDGQGFSPEAVEHMKASDQFDERVGKIYRINGENDFVNPFGVQISQEGNTIYIKQDVDPLDIVGFHDISSKFNPDGTLRQPTNKQGEIGGFITELSNVIMGMPEGERGSISKGIMQLMENTEGNKTSIGGEQANFFDYFGMVIFGTPTLIDTLIKTPEGRKFILKYVPKLTLSIYDNVKDWVHGIINNAADWAKDRVDGIRFWWNSQWGKNKPGKPDHNSDRPFLPCAFSVHTAGLKANTETLQQTYNILADASSNVSRLVGNLPFIIRAASNIDSTLKAGGKRLMDDAKVAREMKKAILDIAQLYERAELGALPQ